MKEIECGSCKYFEQGKNGSFCGNPKQKNKSYKLAIYYTNSCDLHEKGISYSRLNHTIEMQKNIINELKLKS